MQVESPYHKLEDMYSSKSTFIEEFYTGCEVAIKEGGTVVITDVPSTGLLVIKTLEQLNDFRRDFEAGKI